MFSLLFFHDFDASGSNPLIEILIFVILGSLGGQLQGQTVVRQLVEQAFKIVWAVRKWPGTGSEPLQVLFPAIPASSRLRPAD